MDREELARRLMSTYLGELQEHVRALNRDLLALEKGPPPDDRSALLQALFRAAHSLKGASRSVGLGEVERLSHRLEDVLARVRERRLALGPETLALLFRAADAFEEAGGRLREGRPLAGGCFAEVVAALAAAAAGGRGEPAPAPGESAPRAAPEGPAPRAAGEAAAPVRVAADRLDALLARAGELLVARRRAGARGERVAALQDMVRRWHAEWRRARILRGAEEPLRRLGRDLERLAAGLDADRRLLEAVAGPLEEEVRRLRMVPFAEACTGLDRAVRDLARAGGKEAELAVEGGEIEIDRAVLEALRDPLLHLVRNAVDHGIEPPAARRTAGKPPAGRIRVSAALRGPRVEVAVSDDGRGLDLAAIRNEARRRGLPIPEDDASLARFVFRPGFSTAPMVTEVSGRGVGLDVARTRAESLQGTADVSFEPGRGARFVLAVPLTLTTVRALLVEAGGRTFAFLASAVGALRRAGAGDLRAVEGREAILVDGSPVPLVSLAGLLGLPPREAAAPVGKAPVVIASADGRTAGFVVDALVAEQEIVVKALGPRLDRVRNVAGATILADGRTALILHAADLVRSAFESGAARPLSETLAAKGPGPRKRLLVVEDSVTTRTLVTTILEGSGYEVLASADGEEAWRILQEKGADLVVADVEMPRMDGIALTSAIRGSKRWRDLPVVLVTALERDEDKARGMEAGADAYLPKSAFDQAALLQAIGQLL